MLWLLAACAPEVPDACEAMCDAGAEATRACLRAWGLGFDAMGYDDAADWRDACSTWAWERARIDAEQGGDLEADCRDKRAVATAGDCDAWLATEW